MVDETKLAEKQETVETLRKVDASCHARGGMPKTGKGIHE